MKTRWMPVFSCCAIMASMVSVANGYDWKQKITYGNDPTRRAARATAAYSATVAGPEIESRRAFSYEPLSVKVGDTVEVAAPTAEMKVGNQVVATVSQGERITVSAVQGPWIGTHVQRSGRQVGGWVLGHGLAFTVSPSKACQ